jgi:ATP-binding protein involved in chromosome partitioning
MTATLITQEQVIEAVRPVQDPDLQRSLVDLNMIKDIAIQGSAVSIGVELTTPACPLRGKIEGDVRDAILTLPGINDVKVQFSHRVRSSGMGMPDKTPIPGVKNTIAVASGKGGVGKSTVAVNIAASLARDGAKVGLLDADVYGPSIPLMMGTSAKPIMRNNKIVPLEAFGVKIMSIGFLLEADRALIWRGPLVAQLINQFLNEVDWGDLDYLIIDLPPGTGDVQLTLVQKIPLSGAVIVTTPQDVALADAIKGIQMFQEVKTPILGIVENMSFFVCPSCGERSEIFGFGGGERTAERYNVPLLGRIPLDTAIRQGGDIGHPLVLSTPDSPSSDAFQAAARQAARKLAIDAAAKPRRATIMLKQAR